MDSSPAYCQRQGKKLNVGLGSIKIKTERKNEQYNVLKMEFETEIWVNNVKRNLYSISVTRNVICEHWRSEGAEGAVRPGREPRGGSKNGGDKD